MYSPLPIGVEVAHFCALLYPMVSHVPGFGRFWLHDRADNINTGFSVVIEGISVVWLQGSMAMRVFWIGTIA